MIVDRYRTMVEALERSLPKADIEQARADLRALFGSIRVVGTSRRFDLRPTCERHSWLCCGLQDPNNLVAGARFTNYRLSLAA